MQNEPEITENPTQPAENKKRKFLILGLIASAVLAAGLIFAIFNVVDNKKKEEEPKAATFRNWLNPDREVKVGNNRYVSTCQVLSLEDINNIVGKLQADEFITENYLDTPVPNDSLPYETSCMYGDSLVLTAEQYSDMSKLKRLGNSVYSLGDDLAEAKIARFETAAKSSSDQGVKDFVAKIKESYAYYQKNAKTYDPKVLETLKTDGLILPIGYSYFSFNVFQDNVVYRIEYKTGLKVEEEKALSDKETVKFLGIMNRLTDRIVENASNPKLSQIPAPTILGDTDKRGDTSILEPCSVLSKKVFQDVTGMEANTIVARKSTQADIQKDRIANRDKVPYFPSNSCTRKNAILGGESTASADTSLSLELEYAESEKAAIDKLQKGGYLDMGPNDAVLQTDAEWAASIKIGDFDPYYIFREGPYIGIVSYTYLKSEGLGSDIKQGQFSNEAHLDAINKIVASLKTDLKKVNE